MVEARTEYRGYWIEKRLVSLSTTSRVKRPDGSWRECLPTIIGGTYSQWFVLKPSADGTPEEIDFAVSEQEARQIIDRLVEKLRAVARQRGSGSSNSGSGTMDREEWVAGRILWKAGKHGLPRGRTHLFADLPDDLRELFAAVAVERAAGSPVLALVDSRDRWTLLATRKVVSLHGEKFHECRLDRFYDAGPRDGCPPGATLDQAGQWKLSWEYLRVTDDTGAVADLWVPCGSEAYALWNILLMFPRVWGRAGQR
jgi:hypothetical protein